MKSKFITAILFIIVLILLLGLVIIGGMIYLDITGSNQNQLIYQLDSIATEEPNDKNAEETQEEINETIQSLLSNTTEETSTTTTNSDINRFFYNQLSGYETIIYDKLYEEKENLKQGNYTIEFEDTFSDLLSTEDGENELGECYQAAIEAFLHDNPDVYYLDVSKMYLNIETTTKFLNTTYNVYITPGQNSTYLSSDFYSTTQIEKVTEAIENVKNTVVNSLSGNDYRKVMTIHDYLIENIEYDSTYGATGTYTIYGALIGKRCVCEGYAKAFKYLCNSAGIECEIMQGTATNSSGTTESHAWNCVKINGTWYEVDVTWDDPIIVGNYSSISDTVKYRYFLKGTITFDRDHVIEYQFSNGGKYFSYPTISEEDY